MGTFNVSWHAFPMTQKEPTAYGTYFFEIESLGMLALQYFFAESLDLKGTAI